MIETKPVDTLIVEGVFESTRFYDKAPSVTSVLKIVQDPEELRQFRESQNYSAIMKQKAEQGTEVHKAIEETTLCGKFKMAKTKHNVAWFKYYAREWKKLKPLHCEYVITDGEVGGTIDHIGEGYMIDWKTCGTKIYKELLVKYKMQLSKYKDMYEKQSGNKIEKLQLVFFSAAGWYKIIEVEDPDKYLQMYNEVLKEWKELYEVYLNYIKEGESQ